MGHRVFATTVENRHVVVVGLGASGEAAARLCARKGARRVVVNDLRGEESFGHRIIGLREVGVEAELGGHRAETFARADMVVLSPGVPCEGVIEQMRAQGLCVVSEVELASWYLRSPIVGITGTNGKSTVTTLIGLMLERSGWATFTGGNLGDPLSNAVDTPAGGPDGRAVVELSSYQLERIAQLRPDVAVHLNLTPDHLDRYGSIAAYGAAKARIFMNQRACDQVVAPGDDPVVLAYARAGAAQVRSFGGEQSDVRINGEAITTPDGGVFPLSLLKIRGTHNVDNAMAAVLAAWLMGASFEAITHVLSTFEGLAHRMQFVAEHLGVVYFDDSKATNVGAAVKAMEGADRTVVLIAGGRDKGGSYDPLVRLLRAKARAVVLLGEAAGLLRTALRGSVELIVAESMADAVARAAEVAVAGDAVLLAPACSSLDMYSNYAERGRDFARCVRALCERGQ